MEVASQTIGEVVKSLMVYVTKHLEYITSYAKHVDHMEERMKVLEGKHTDVKKQKYENDTNYKEVPARVAGWLDEVEIIKEEVESISSNSHMRCFNVKGRHRAAIKALNATVRINNLITENSDITWRDAQIPLGRVDSKPTTVPAPSSLSVGTQIGFSSRKETFNNALRLLQENEKTQVIALCGMGGVGKTTMMHQLKKFVEDKKMFRWIVTVVVGSNPDLKSIQNVVAVYTGEPLTETNEILRADYLHKRFERLSERKENTLVILDDVWSKVELKDIGLCPLRNGIKLLLTSRDVKICKHIATDVNSTLEVLNVMVLEDLEAHDFFCQITGVSKESQNNLYQIGGAIAKECGGLPLAIKLIAATLKSEEKESVWRDTFRSLKNNKDVQEIIKISYDHIKEEEEKAIFLLCGMFPEDSYIPIEDLTRYAWGLKLFDNVSTLTDARDKTTRLVCNLTNASLLIDSDKCVKMHDLVLSFVVNRVTKGEDAWIINHGDMSKWSKVKMSQSCRQISLACKGGSKFPIEFKFRNLSFLKLMQGDYSLSFPDSFYGEMQDLQVIAYDEMKYPLLPSSFQTPNLQTLCLHKCSLTYDLSCIGTLSNLEVLSFTNSHIRKLPSTFKNLKKLRILDLTECDGDLVIDDGVLENLVSLEELYMKVDYKRKGISFTDYNRKELAELSSRLYALDIEFFEKKAQPQNMLFKRLERFRISVGCLLHKSMPSYENTLMLIMNRGELWESRMNELFEKTEVLFLTVDGMNNLVDVAHPSPQYSPFHKIRDLTVSNCGELGYLFTIDVARALSKLERLEISSCQILEALLHIESDGAHTITFPKLKILILYDLPKLSCLCSAGNVLVLSQLMNLELFGLPNFTSIYSNNKLATSSMLSNISTTRPLLNDELYMLCVNIYS